jgi:hypothetical protein
MMVEPRAGLLSEPIRSHTGPRAFSPAATPWYREPWPWLLMAGPAAVIIAGAITTLIALRSFDGLTAEDYYKQGLAVNKVLARAQTASALGVSAELRWPDGESGRVQLDLQSSSNEQPAALRLTLNHPTRAGADRSVWLHALGYGRYAGRIERPDPGRWSAIVEDDGRRWRIRAELSWPADRMVLLKPAH